MRVPFNVPLEKAKVAMLPKFNGDLPVARINYFAIFELCTQLFEQVAVEALGVELNPVTGIVGDGLVMLDMFLGHLGENSRDDRKRRRLLSISKRGSGEGILF